MPLIGLNRSRLASRLPDEGLETSGRPLRQSSSEDAVSIPEYKSVHGTSALVTTSLGRPLHSNLQWQTVAEFLWATT